MDVMRKVIFEYDTVLRKLEKVESENANLTAELKDAMRTVRQIVSENTSLQTELKEVRADHKDLERDVAAARAALVKETTAVSEAKLEATRLNTKHDVDIKNLHDLLSGSTSACAAAKLRADKFEKAHAEAEKAAARAGNAHAVAMARMSEKLALAQAAAEKDQARIASLETDIQTVSKKAEKDMAEQTAAHSLELAEMHIAVSPALSLCPTSSASTPTDTDVCFNEVVSILQNLGEPTRDASPGKERARKCSKPSPRMKRPRPDASQLYLVKSITNHRNVVSKNKGEYHVAWDDGSFSWEPWNSVKELDVFKEYFCKNVRL